MYDPEYSLEQERSLILDQIRLAKVEKRCGRNHPWTKIVQLVTDILKTISRKENDLDNCWDEKKQKEIELEIADLLDIARLALAN